MNIITGTVGVLVSAVIIYVAGSYAIDYLADQEIERRKYKEAYDREINAARKGA